METALDRFLKIKDSERTNINIKYRVEGFISAGTYGRVFKARRAPNASQRTSIVEYAIKKFKPEKEGSISAGHGISQSACREIALCKELHHFNVVHLEEVILDPIDRSIYMIIEYAEHDLLQILHYHSTGERKPIPDFSIKSFMWQLLNGVAYLHANWVLHRDLKPANILVTENGVVKIADLGLARIFQAPIKTMMQGDKVVVTLWYRAPELLLGSRHYTKAIDMWSVGCIFAELILLRPIFKGDEVKAEPKKPMPFQKDQLSKIFEILGRPNVEKWPNLQHMPEFSHLKEIGTSATTSLRHVLQQSSLKTEQGVYLMAALLEYDPEKRLSAEAALSHAYCVEDPKPQLKDGPKAIFIPNSENPKDIWPSLIVFTVYFFQALWETLVDVPKIRMFFG